jgi:hypothetical protein
MAPTAIKPSQEITLHTPDPGAFRLETVARAGRALRLIEQILQRGKEEASQAEEKSDES